MRKRPFALFIIFTVAVALFLVSYVLSRNSLEVKGDLQNVDINAMVQTIYLPAERGFDILEATEGQTLYRERRCPMSDCKIITNKSQAHASNCYMFREHIPKRIPARQSGQIWVFYSLEPPWRHPYMLRQLRHKVNWTITYRHDSTIPIAYNKIIQRTANTSLSKIFLDLGTKSKPVAWFVSNCSPNNRRMEYANELGKYISVDIYGRCGTMQCKPIKSDNCLKKLRTDYKFYLAFENCNCREYITEKFFNALIYDVIPIVMGAPPEDYQKVAPPHSYIHVEDYESPQHLAQYLHKLDKNDTHYHEYFKWKETLTVGSYDTSYWCDLCAMLHNNTSGATWYPDIKSWWGRDGVCSGSKSWKQFRNEPSLTDWHRYIW